MKTRATFSVIIRCSSTFTKSNFRFHKFILWLGIPLHQVADTKPNEFCRVISEFALEYRTTRERVLQQLEKKANHRERNKTRGKMITEVSGYNFRFVPQTDANNCHGLQNTWLEWFEVCSEFPFGKIPLEVVNSVRWFNSCRQESSGRRKTVPMPNCVNYWEATFLMWTACLERSRGGVPEEISTAPSWVKPTVTSPMEMMRYWRAWWRRLQKPHRRGRRPGKEKGHDTQTASHVSDVSFIYFLSCFGFLQTW